MIGRWSLLILLTAALISAAQTSYFTLSDQDKNHLVVEWNSPELSWHTMHIGETSYQLPECGDLVRRQREGYPQLPVDAVVLEVSGTSARVRIVDSVTVASSVARICPAPMVRAETTEENNVVEYRENQAAYSQNRFQPSSFVDTEWATIRGRQFLRLQINPVKYNPVAGAVEHARYLRITINSDETLSTPSAQIKNQFDRHLEKFPAAKLGFPASKKKSVLEKKSVSPFFNEKLPHVKIGLVQEGVYSISGSDLEALGVPLSSIDPQTFQLFERDNEQPFQLEGVSDGQFSRNDRLLFYGNRLHGENEFYHAYTDTNVYWLSWGDNDGQRMTMAASPESGTVVIDHTPFFLHIEKDLDYYRGDTNSAIQNSYDTPGEGWVWEKYIDPGNTFNVDFDLPGVVMSQDSILFRLRVRGETLSPFENDHHIRVKVNDRIAVDQFFSNREEKIYQFSVPVSAVSATENTLSIHSVDDTEAHISRFYFDWFAIEYDKYIIAEEHAAKISYFPDKEPVTLLAGGFETSDVTIWDLGSGQLLEPKVNKEYRAAITVSSASMGSGNYARFIINGQQVYSGSRGMNIVTLDAETGRVTHKKSFDTYASRQQADSLTAFLNSLPANTVVLAGIRDDGANNLHQAAREAFQALGSEKVTELVFRDSWALISRVGDPESAVEQRMPNKTGAATVSATFTFSQGSEHYNVLFTVQDSVGSDYIVFEDQAVRQPLSLSLRTNIENPVNSQANYIIITHKTFIEQAEQLAEYRSSRNSLSANVALVEDIYDYFNHGVKNPWALYDFLKQAFETWETEPAQYVLLFGDGSWDPKKNISSSYVRDFVPVLGNPVSDAMFVCFDGPDDFLPDLSIGRLPVATVQQAEHIIDKIIEYESTPSAAWKKSFLFISGGFNQWEQQSFNQQSEKLDNEFASAMPVMGDVYHVQKSTETLIEGEHTQKIINYIDQGMAWINFIGHAGSRTWELIFHNSDIDRLNNKPRYPFISSMTCHTGRFAEPNDVSFGEHFLLTPDRGTVAFWGTSGWGYSYEDYLYLRKLYGAVLEDTVNHVGDAISLAKYELWKTHGQSPHNVNLILQYNLMGDPAMKLALPEKPDLAVRSSDIAVDPVTPSEPDSTAHIIVPIHNYGLVPPDTSEFSLSVVPLDNPDYQLAFSQPVPFIAQRDTLRFNWPLANMTGPVDITATADFGDIIAEVDETNNQASLRAHVLSGKVRLVSPLPFAVVPSTDVQLTIENPPELDQTNLEFEFQIDTTAAFNSSLLQSSGPVAAELMTTSWKPVSLQQGYTYYWRARIIEENEIKGWKTRSFSIQPDSPNVWHQAGLQAASNTLENTKVTASGVHLDEHAISLRVESAGMADGNFARILVNGSSIMKTNRGINIAVLDNACLDILQTEHFDTYGDPAATENLAALIDSLATGTIVLAGVKDEASARLEEKAYTALESIGSAFCRNIGLRDSWAILGHKGAATGSVLESYKPKTGGVATVGDTLYRFFKSGTISTGQIGPATSWKKCRVEADVPDNTTLSVHVLGYAGPGSQIDTLFTLKEPGTFDLSHINSSDIPSLSLAGQFKSTCGLSTPSLKFWTIEFEPSGDVAVSPNLFSQSHDTLSIGQNVTLFFDVYNIGATFIDSTAITLEASHPQLGRFTIARTTVDSLAPGKYRPVQQQWTPANSETVKKLPTGLYKLYITLDPDNRLNEPSETNNSLRTTVFVQDDTLKPKIDISVDGRNILDGDLVSSTPTIFADLYDNTPNPITDTTRVNVFLDGVRIPYKNSAALELGPGETRDACGRVTFKPNLSDGPHVLTITAMDAYQNVTSKDVEFEVESDLIIRDVLNYPNPFAEETDFYFQTSQTAKVEIKIYTVAGRLIRNIDKGWVGVGYNRIHWDGRDGNGDVLANGVYLYKIMVRKDDERVEKTSKCIIMR